MKNMKEFLNKWYQATSLQEKDELRKELIKILVSGMPPEEAEELVDDILKYVHGFHYYKQIVVSIREVFEEILS